MHAHMQARPYLVPVLASPGGLYGKSLPRNARLSSDLTALSTKLLLVTAPAAQQLYRILEHENRFATRLPNSSARPIAKDLVPARSGQVRSGQVRSGQVRSGQVRSGQICYGNMGEQHHRASARRLTRFSNQHHKRITLHTKCDKKYGHKQHVNACTCGDVISCNGR
jgi:hypothetical protein